ncbi:MAG: HD-GYP domain-containing protein [Lachnospiraceae bacterium]|nr:HD-GYP domain-containing protein [Lachnospiraceae bacterium]
MDLNGGVSVREKIDIDPLKYILNMEYIDGKIWICAGNGIGVLEDGKIRLIENVPMNNNVGHVMTDYLGNLWFTSTRQGVMKVVPNQFSDLFQRYDMPETVVNSTCMCDGKLFAATDTGLIVFDEKGPVSKFPLKKAVTASGVDLGAEDLIEFLKDTRIRSVIRDSRGRVWISTWRASGLLRYDKGELTAFIEEEGILSNNLRAVYEREDGAILVVVTGGVNVIKDDSVIASWGKEDGIDTEESLTVTEGTDGDIVLGSNGGGIYVIGESGLKKTINVEDGLPSDIVMRVKKDKKRDLIWIVASNAIAYMTPDYQVTTVKKFPYPNNFDLYETSGGDIWVLASNGIYVTRAEELIANEEINPVFYSVASGLPCIATANSYSELTPEGDLYIAGSTGICKVNIEKPYEDVNVLKAAVPYVLSDGQAIYPDEDGNFTIPSGTQKLTVPGFVYNYALSDPLVSYQLKGFERNSTTVNRSDLIPSDYTNLKGGTYDFEMQLKDSMGRGSKVITVRIVKEKAFYEEIWFFIVVLLLALVLLVIIVRFYVIRKTRKLEKKNQETREQFEQTAEALASAIDAKDRYTNGHSRRVAEYSMNIAKEAGKSKDECERIYFSAPLHDVGKIGVPIEILSKKGRLTDEEFERIKQHPVVGGQILSSIRRSPWLSIGARFHHERINGKGYPEALKGEDIPEIARIIAVADAYDAMTSNRSYRSAIPQHIVREEMVKGIGSQFDPEFAKIMIHMIDLDTGYDMQESKPDTVSALTAGFRCDSLYHDCSEGVPVSSKTTRIRFCSQPDDGIAYEGSLPTLILFDSLNGEVHPGEEENRNILYFEYAQIRIDCKVAERNTRKTRVSVPDQETILEPARPGEPEREQHYIVEAVQYRDHVLVKIYDEKKVTDIILALPDNARKVHVAISGERCYIHNIMIENEENEIGAEAIPRIAEEISYIKDRPEGDVPNVQFDGWCSDATEGIRIDDGLTLRFHTMSLPTARLIWHCPYISMFTSSDGLRNGSNYRQYLLLRMDGEDWSSDEHAENTVRIERKNDFVGWDDWKEKNKQGLDCTVVIRKEKNTITMHTENLGIVIDSTSTIRGNVKNLFVAVTGEQCAITDIHIDR